MCPVLPFLSETAIFSARYCVGFSSVIVCSVAHFFCQIPNEDFTSASDIEKHDDHDKFLLILICMLIGQCSYNVLLCQKTDTLEVISFLGT